MPGVKNLVLHLPDGKHLSLDGLIRTYDANENPFIKYGPHAIESASRELLEIANKNIGAYLSTEGIEVGDKLKKFGSFLLEKIKALIATIGNFLKMIFEKLQGGWNKYVVSNSANLAKSIRNAKDKIATTFNEQKINIYVAIHSGLISFEWFKTAGKNISALVSKVLALGQRAPKTEEEAQQMQNEVKSYTEQAAKILDEGAQKAQTVGSPTAESSVEILAKATGLAPIHEKIKDEFGVMLKNIHSSLGKFQSSVSSAVQSGKSHLISLFSAIVSFFGTVSGKLSRLPIIKGILARNSEIQHLKKESTLQSV